jgi:hypothetical protein
LRGDLRGRVAGGLLGKCRMDRQFDEKPHTRSGATDESLCEHRGNHQWSDARDHGLPSIS